MREPTKEDADAAAALVFELCAPGCAWEDEPNELSSQPRFETKSGLRAIMGAVLAQQFNRMMKS